MEGERQGSGGGHGRRKGPRGIALRKIHNLLEGHTEGKKDACVREILRIILNFSTCDGNVRRAVIHFSAELK